jgi:hypothetical protein
LISIVTLGIVKPSNSAVRVTAGGAGGDPPLAEAGASLTARAEVLDNGAAGGYPHRHHGYRLGPSCRADRPI